MTRPSLALVIPTYRRTATLAAGLARMADALDRHDVALYIVDENPDDEAERMVAAFAADHARVHYRHNRPALGHDANILASLLWPSEDYVWVLGDAGWIEPDRLGPVIDLIDRQDFVFVNSHAPAGADVPLATGADAHRLIRDFLWHQTLTGATIYSRRVLDWLRGTRLAERGAYRNFPHLAVILDYAASHDVTLGWAGTPTTRFAPKQSYWQNRALETFVDDWAAIVRRQPGVIPPHEARAVLRSHSARLGLFHGALLRDLRRRGQLTRRYVRSQPDFFAAMHLPRWKVEAILRLPRWLLDRLFRDGA